MILAAHDPVEHVLPHAFFRLSSSNLNCGQDSVPLLGFPLSTEFWFTNHLLMTLVAAGLCLLIFPRLARAYVGGIVEPGSPPRGKFMNLFESMLQFIREEVARPVLKHRTDAFMPFLWTLFFFILFCNLLGMVPLADIVRLLTFGNLVDVGGTATGNLAVTGGLAICAFLMIHVSGVREVYSALRAGTYGHHGHDEAGEHGATARAHAAPLGLSPTAAALGAVPLYLWNFAPHVFRPAPGAGLGAALALHVLDLLMWLLLLVLEFIGAVIKPFALMIRLFANMIAGHIVLGSILLLIFTAQSVMLGYTIGVISTLGCVALSCLELFVAFLQAYIFVFLTTLFISMSVAPEH